MRIALALGLWGLMVILSQSTQAMAVPACSLASEGIYQGAWVKHRIYVNEDVVFGANDMNSILSQLDNLRGQGLCR